MSRLTDFLSRIRYTDKLLFLAALITLFFLYEYNQTMWLGPESMHIWRQSDSIAFVMMYYDHGMNFFEPKVFNLLMKDGSAVGECPIIYYLVACLYKIFGPDEFIFRLVVFTLFILGLHSLYNLTLRFTRDRFFAFVLPLLVFSSPVIMLYANNFLCDIPSLSMTFIGWDFFLRYKDNQKKKQFVFSMVFFALAALLKLNAAISFVALGAIFFIELNGWQKSKENNVFKHVKLNILGFVLAMTVVFLWYWWAIDYNDRNVVSFLGTKTWPGWPIWETTNENFVATINGYFADSVYIFFQPTYALMLFLVLFVLANRSNADWFTFNLFLLILVGVALFTFTFFLGIRQNIYYCINLMILPVFIFIAAIQIIKNKYPVTFHSFVFRGMIFIFLVVNVGYAKGTLKDFYHKGPLHYRVLEENVDLKKFRNFIDTIGVAKTDKVICFPDNAPDVLLSVIGRQGWSEYNFSRSDTSAINTRIKAGAKYLIIQFPYIIGEPNMCDYTGNLVGRYEGIYVYKLGEGQKNTKNRSGLLKIDSSQYVTEWDNNGGRMLYSADTSKSVNMRLVSLGKDMVALKVPNGDFVASDPNQNGRIFIGSTWLGVWEVFNQKDLGDGKFVLCAANGKYVRVKPDEGNALRADAEAVEAAAKFQFQ